MEEPAAMGFRTIDAMTFAVFLMVEAALFTEGQMAAVLGHVTVFLALDVLFAAFQTVGLPGAEPAGGDTVVDAALFVVQTTVHFIDARMAGVDGAGAVWNDEGAEHRGASKGEKRFHGM